MTCNREREKNRKRERGETRIPKYQTPVDISGWMYELVIDEGWG